MIQFFSFLLFLGIINSTYAQNYSFTPINTISKAARWIEVDKMNHLYLIENDHTLIKYNANGDLLYQFNENGLGQISHVDVTNPFRILVYYDDYATVILLDRTLSEIQRHDLSDLDIPQVQALSTASDNNIWIFDSNSYTLKKVDSQNQIVVESIDLNLFLSEDLAPNRLLEAETRVYLNSPNLGILVFDVFGNYIKTINIPQLDYFQFYEGQIFYVEDKIFKTYHLLSFQTKEINLPVIEDNLEQLCIAQERLYIKYPNKTNIIALKKK